jgi:hypothetical protein
LQHAYNNRFTRPCLHLNQDSLCGLFVFKQLLTLKLCAGTTLGLQVVPVGDKLVDHNASFKLYLVTRNASPQLSPDVLPLLTVTNFSITRSGLESKWRCCCRCCCYLQISSYNAGMPACLHVLEELSVPMTSSTIAFVSNSALTAHMTSCQKMIICISGTVIWLWSFPTCRPAAELYAAARAARA